MAASHGLYGRRQAAGGVNKCRQTCCKVAENLGVRGHSTSSITVTCQVIGFDLVSDGGTIDGEAEAITKLKRTSQGSSGLQWIFHNRSSRLTRRIADHRPIVRAIDRDGDGLIGSGTELIGDAGGESLGRALALGQGLGGRQGVVEGVGPATGAGINGDRAVGGGGVIDDRPAAGGAGVDIGGGEGAGHSWRSRICSAVIQVTRLSHAAELRCRRGGYNGLIVAAVDGDGDRLIGDGPLVVGDASREALGCALALGQGLGGSGVVVEGVGPDAGAGIDGDRAVSGGRGAFDRPGACGAAVDIGSGERAGYRAGAGESTAIVVVARLKNGTGTCGGYVGDDRGIIAAADRNIDGLINDGALVVDAAGDVALVDGLAFCQGLRSGQRVVERVGPGATGRIDGDGAVGPGSGYGGRQDGGS